jgi:hypothetical protein
MQLLASSAEIRGLIRGGRHQEARALLCARSLEEQAVLVSLDEEPEEVLSLTAMDDRGQPSYRSAVVDRLPTETLADMLVPSTARHLRFNLDVLRAMSPKAFARAVDETLEPVLYSTRRTEVCWEWLEAVAALADPQRTAELLDRLDVDIIEDAFLERIGAFDLHAVVGMPGSAGVSAFRLLSESGVGMRLPPILNDATKAVAQAIQQAAPELLHRVLRTAWERAGAGP